MEKTFIFAGFGGQGMLLIGKFMAMSCMLDGKHVSWLPSYGPEMRGGTANCSVIVSDDPVASPLVDKADVIVAMNRPSLDKFEEHVKPGGVLVINSSIIDRKSVRDDIKVVYCDANAIAESVGNPKGANVAILGAVMAADPVNILSCIGQEDVDYLVDGDGSWRLIESNQSNYDMYKAGTLIEGGTEGPGVMTGDFQSRISGGTLVKTILEKQAQFSEYVRMPFPYYTLTREQEAEIAPLQAEIGYYVDMQLARWVLGEAEISDESFAQFEQQLNELGLDRFLAFWQDVLDRQ